MKFIFGSFLILSLAACASHQKSDVLLGERLPAQAVSSVVNLGPSKNAIVKRGDVSIDLSECEKQFLPIKDSSFVQCEIKFSNIKLMTNEPHFINAHQNLSGESGKYTVFGPFNSNTTLYGINIGMVVDGNQKPFELMKTYLKNEYNRTKGRSAKDTYWSLIQNDKSLMLVLENVLYIPN